MLQYTLDLGLETSDCLHCVWDVHKYPRMLQDTLDLRFETADCLYCLWDVLKYPRMLQDTLDLGFETADMYGMSISILGCSSTHWTWDLRQLTCMGCL